MILKSEWALLRRSRSLKIILFLFFIACTVATFESVTSYQRELDLHQQYLIEEQERIASLIQAIETPSDEVVPSWQDPTNPGVVGRGKAAAYAILPMKSFGPLRKRWNTASLVHVVTGGNALDHIVKDSVHPRLESVGKFDLSFLILVIMPLTIILVIFDLITRDRESGVLRLLSAQSGGLLSRYIIRMGLRLTPIVGMVFVSVMVAALSVGSLSLQAIPLTLAILFSLILYAAFWGGLTLIVQSWCRASATSGVLSLAVWTVFVVLIPATVFFVADLLVQVPSRIERTSASREAYRAATLDTSALLARYFEDHPELADVNVDAGNYYALRVAIDDRVSLARNQVESKYFSALDKKDKVSRQVSFFSPMLLMGVWLDDVSGASQRRINEFYRVVNKYQINFAKFFNEKTLRGEKISVLDLKKRPEFQFKEVTLVYGALVGLFIWVSLVFFVVLIRIPKATSLD